MFKTIYKIVVLFNIQDRMCTVSEPDLFSSWV